MSDTVEVTLNGESVTLASPATIADAVVRAGVGTGDARGVAVALDGEVVTHSRWAETRLAPGQSVEVVRAIQGGGR